MALRLTTWNVNGIRNPFNYQPWRDTRSFQGMFDILETDIIAFQETKIQRKDLRDDMVLVEGWDCYFSLPRVKKGYSGVVIYTRNSTCAPIRAEEGVTGILCPPKSTTSFRDLPEDQQIGGYPTAHQLSASDLDAGTLDSEGRCVILEFPAFVLLGVYSPATRDVSRDDFRLGFLSALECRIRNLIAMGKRVVLMGDLNIARSAMDSAHCREQIRKNNITEDEYISSPSRRMFNHLVRGGKIVGERDEGREEPVLADLCREFHPDRMGMYTCWEQRINARPGNYGARIDYVLCSLDMRDWFESANIQEGLMGSDHCPVYATCKEKVMLDGAEVHIRDVMNPPGTFENGERKQEYSAKNILAISGRMIPEFNRRRNIADMLFRKPSSTDNSPRDTPSLARQPSSLKAEESDSKTPTPVSNDLPEAKTESPMANDTADKSATPISANPKRTLQRSSSQSQPPAKRSKSTSTSASTGQRTLKGFFASSRQQSEDDCEPSIYKSKPDMPAPPPPLLSSTDKPSSQSQSQSISETIETAQQQTTVSSASTSTSSPSRSRPRSKSPPVHDPIANKESWSKLFSKKSTPKCEGHNEPCITYTTKKPGVNCGRSFWICARPLGPSGNKEVGTQWRCGTFIWSSDWNG